MSRIGFCGAKNTHVVVVGSRATGVARANFTHAPGPGMPLPNAENQAGATLGCGGDLQQASPGTPGNKIPLRRAPIRTLTVPITMSVTPVPTLARGYRTWQLRMFISGAGQTWDAAAMVLVAGCQVCPMAHCSR